MEILFLQLLKPYVTISNLSQFSEPDNSTIANWRFFEMYEWRQVGERVFWLKNLPENNFLSGSKM